MPRFSFLNTAKWVTVNRTPTGRRWGRREGGSVIFLAGASPAPLAQFSADEVIV